MKTNQKNNENNVPREFIGKYFTCFSPYLRNYLFENGLGLGVEGDAVWKAEDRIKYLKKKGIPYDEETITDLNRKKWSYEVSEELSKCLNEWSNNRP